jgi:cytoskeleton protein RodZ
MSEAEALSGQPQASPGAMLRQAREAAGLHIAALAVALRIINSLIYLMQSLCERWPAVFAVR